jgi:hypothetical protein
LTWQGWAVLVAFTVLLVLGNLLFPPATKLGAFFGYVGALCAALVGVCYLKGEPPKWRWRGR